MSLDLTVQKVLFWLKGISCLIIFQKAGKMLKAAKEEGIVDIGKAKENILESRKENLKGKKNTQRIPKKTSTEFTVKQTWDWLRNEI